MNLYNYEKLLTNESWAFEFNGAMVQKSNIAWSWPMTLKTCGFAGTTTICKIIINKIKMSLAIKNNLNQCYKSLNRPKPKGFLVVEQTTFVYCSLIYCHLSQKVFILLLLLLLLLVDNNPVTLIERVIGKLRPLNRPTFRLKISKHQWHHWFKH